MIPGRSIEALLQPRDLRGDAVLAPGGRSLARLVASAEAPLDLVLEACGRRRASMSNWPLPVGSDGRPTGAVLSLHAVEAADIVARTNRLTPREREVLALVSEGCSNRELARRLGFRELTARNHVGSVLRKLGCGRRGEAVAVARARGLL